MKTSLKTTGNGWDLYFPTTILKLLKYDIKNIKILITSKGNVLYCEPVKIEDEEKYKNCLLKNIRKSGSGYGMYIPIALLEVMGVNPETDFVDMEINDDKFTLKKWKES